MSKKDYQAIAAEIHAAYLRADPGWTRNPRSLAENAGGIAAIRGLCYNLITVFEAANPRFDRFCFIEACETGRCKGMRTRHD
jgi:hypothetical protein